MIMALKSSPFSDSLCKQSPTTLDKLRARIVGFIHMEEMTKFKEKVHGKSSRKPTKREAKTKSSHNKGKSRVDRPPQSKFSQYTTLMESWSRLLEQPHSVEIIQLSSKKWPPLGVAKSKYCRYHWVIDQNTKECINLKEKIEKLI